MVSRVYRGRQSSIAVVAKTKTNRVLIAHTYLTNLLERAPIYLVDNLENRYGVFTNTSAAGYSCIAEVAGTPVVDERCGCCIRHVTL